MPFESKKWSYRKKNPRRGQKSSKKTRPFCQKTHPLGGKCALSYPNLGNKTSTDFGCSKKMCPTVIRSAPGVWGVGAFGHAADSQSTRRKQSGGSFLPATFLCDRPYLSTRRVFRRLRSTQSYPDTCTGSLYSLEYSRAKLSR